MKIRNRLAIYLMKRYSPEKLAGVFSLTVLALIIHALLFVAWLIFGDGLGQGSLVVWVFQLFALEYAGGFMRRYKAQIQSQSRPVKYDLGVMFAGGAK